MPLHSSDLHSFSSKQDVAHLSSPEPGVIDPAALTHFDFGYTGLDGALLIHPEPIPKNESLEVDTATTTRGIEASSGSLPELTDMCSSDSFTRLSVTGPTSRLVASEDPSENSQQCTNIDTLEDALSDDLGISGDGCGDGTDLGGRPKEDKADAAPPWSELKTKAGKERKRLPLACIACRRKKIRCSGEKPACKHCLRSRIPCVYKVSTRKAAPRTDYMAMLDKRLKRMEERIIKIVPKSEQEQVCSVVTRAMIRPIIPGTLAEPTVGYHGFGTGRITQKVKSSLESDLKRWSMQSQPRTEGIDGKRKVHNIEDSGLFSEGSKALPDKDLQEHLANVFFDSIYGQAYHLLHKPSYMRKLKNGTLPPVLVLSICAVAARFSTHPKFCSTANFSRGEKWASEAREIVTRRYDWPNITILTCLLILGLHEFGTCQGGRSWALGGQATRMAFALQLHKDLEYDPTNGSGSEPLSFIDREIRRRTMWACFLMDRFNSSGTDRPMFIREETVRIPLPIKEKHFQLDIPGSTEFLDGSVASPRPLSTVDVNATVSGGIINANENMGVAAYMIRSIALWGRIISYVNQGGREADPLPFIHPASSFSKLRAEVADFQESLPPSLRYSDENLHLHDTENMSSQFLFLHISIQQNILFASRSVMTCAPASLACQRATNSTSIANNNLSANDNDNSSDAFIAEARETAFAAANRISELLRVAESHFVTAPFVGYCAFLSSTVHITGLYSQTGSVQMIERQKRNLATNIKYLGKMKRYWGMFHWVVENLREQYRIYHDATHTLASNTNTSALVGRSKCLNQKLGLENARIHSSLFQYGDWFDRYPHGLSCTGSADPATPNKKEKGDDAVLEQKPELHTVEDYFTSLLPRQVENVHIQETSSAKLKRKAFGQAPMEHTKRPRQHLQSDHIVIDTNDHVQTHLETKQQDTGLQGLALGFQTSDSIRSTPLAILQSSADPGYHTMPPMSSILGSGSTPFSIPAVAQTHALAHYPPELLNALQQSTVNMPSATSVPNTNLDRHTSPDELDRSYHISANSECNNRVDFNSDSWVPPQFLSRNTHKSYKRSTATTVFALDSSAWFSPFNIDADAISHEIVGDRRLDNFNAFDSGEVGDVLETQSTICMRQQRH